VNLGLIERVFLCIIGARTPGWIFIICRVSCIITISVVEKPCMLGIPNPRIYIYIHPRKPKRQNDVPLLSVSQSVSCWIRKEGVIGDRLLGTVAGRVG